MAVWLTDLADHVRAGGLRVVEVPGWRTRGHGGLTSVDGVVAHHTAGPASGDYPSRSIVVDGRPGLDGPLANLGLARSGTVHVVAAGLAYHAGQVQQTTYANGRRIGIEAEATGRDGVSTDWPAEQLSAYWRLCAVLAVAYHFPVSEVLGHKEVCYPRGRKIDPHPVDMGAFREQVARIAATLRTSRDVPVRTIPAPRAERPVLARGNRGSAVKALQQRLDALAWDVDATGVFDEQTRRAVLGVQVAAGLVPDAVVGPRTWGVVDGGRRPRFTTATDLAQGDHGGDVVDVQRALTRVGIPTDDDGVFGPTTRRNVRRRQAQLDLPDDGVVGTWTAAALGGRRA